MCTDSAPFAIPVIHSLQLSVLGPGKLMTTLLLALAGLGQWETKAGNLRAVGERLEYFSPAHFLIGLCYSDLGSSHWVAPLSALMAFQ